MESKFNMFVLGKHQTGMDTGIKGDTDSIFWHDEVAVQRTYKGGFSAAHC